MRCPINCSKYQEANEAVKILSNRNKTLRAEKNALLEKARMMDSLQVLADKGYQIIGIEQNCVIAMWPIPINVWESDRHFYLFKLPFEHHSDYICRLHLEYRANCRASIMDWTSKVHNQGYGSLMMKHLINFLRASGIRYVTGSIAKTDFDHEVKLRHFYTKFGFKITDYENSRGLHLDLFNEQVFPLKHEGHLVCCRSDTYPSLRAEKIIEDSHKNPSATE
ncbi:MAG: GNAT family N-acetyltransferase [Oscillospiraceae bacterium]|nr:GNAT family N-acetyltransferase [Oscillospiraceae bacterium]